MHIHDGGVAGPGHRGAPAAGCGSRPSGAPLASAAGREFPLGHDTKMCRSRSSTPSYRPWGVSSLGRMGVGWGLGWEDSSSLGQVPRDGGLTSPCLPSKSAPRKSSALKMSSSSAAPSCPGPGDLSLGSQLFLASSSSERSNDLTLITQQKVGATGFPSEHNRSRRLFPLPLGNQAVAKALKTGWRETPN